MLSARTACFSLPPVWVGKALQLACAASREKEESEREREQYYTSSYSSKPTEAAVEIFAASSTASSLKLGLPL